MSGAVWGSSFNADEVVGGFRKSLHAKMTKMSVLLWVVCPGQQEADDFRLGEIMQRAITLEGSEQGSEEVSMNKQACVHRCIYHYIYIYVFIYPTPEISKAMNQRARTDDAAHQHFQRQLAPGPSFFAQGSAFRTSAKSRATPTTSMTRSGSERLWTPSLLFLP